MDTALASFDNTNIKEMWNYKLKYLMANESKDAESTKAIFNLFSYFWSLWIIHAAH